MRVVLPVLGAAMMLASVGPSSQGKQIIAGPRPDLPFSAAVRAGDFIYLGGSLASDDPAVLKSSDIRTQTAQVLDNLAAVLKSTGSDLAHVVSVNVYLRDGGDFGAMNEVYQTYFPKEPPVRTTVVTGLLFDALVEMSMIAVPAGGERAVIHPPDWIRSPSPYSYGIKSGNTLFLAGLVSRSGRDNTVVKGDMAAQVRTIMENAGDILRAGGMSYGDVVSSRVYIEDAPGFQQMNAAYRPYFEESPPARATVVVGLPGPDYFVEMTFTAVQDTAREVVRPDPAARPNPVLSPAIRVGNRLYLSGMLGNTPETRGDAGGQTRETLNRIGRTLEAAGFDWSHVVDGTVWLTDLGDYQAMNAAYRERFAADFPARATIGTGLVVPDGLVEIMFTAVK